MPEVRILVVDDEPELCRLLQRYLARIGYDVRISPSGEDAWETIGRTPEPFEVFLIDLNLPGMSGGDLIERVLSSQPEARILITSGYPLERPPADNAHGRLAFLQKPFTPTQLALELAKLRGGTVKSSRE